jgi:hypothetical protein
VGGGGWREEGGGRGGRMGRGGNRDCTPHGNAGVQQMMESLVVAKQEKEGEGIEGRRGEAKRGWVSERNKRGKGEGRRRREKEKGEKKEGISTRGTKKGEAERGWVGERRREGEGREERRTYTSMATQTFNKWWNLLLSLNKVSQSLITSGNSNSWERRRVNHRKL